MDKWDLFGVLLGLFNLAWGIHGVVNRKRIRNVAHFILSIAQITGGVMILAAAVSFMLKDAGKLGDVTEWWRKLSDVFK